MKRLDSEALATLVAIVDAGSFTAAARKLGRTQAGVSNAIARLESRLGKKLFDRSKRSLCLTSPGEILTGYARRLIAIEDEALAALQPDALTGQVRVGMPDDYLGVFGPSLITRFSTENPRVRVEVFCDFSSELENLVDHGELDMAIVTRGMGSKRGELLREEPLVWCAAPETRVERETPLPLALFPEKLCRARPIILDALGRAGRSWCVVWTSSHLPSIQTAVSLGKAVTALPMSVTSSKDRLLGQEDGLPPLKPVELALLVPQDARASVRRMASFIRREFQRPASGL